MAHLGYRDDTLIAAGLCGRSKRGTVYDRFRDRLTFGIRSVDGTLLGFTARTSPNSPPEVPKYLNTPQTTLYTKARALFGLGETAGFPGPVVITEGPLDAIAIDLSNDHRYRPLALCGTALTLAQTDHIASLEPQAIIMALDPDRPGQRALVQASATLSSLDAQVLVSMTESLLVPAALITETERGGLDNCLRNAQPLADHLVQTQLATWPEARTNAEAAIACLRATAQRLNVARCAAPAHAAETLSRALGLSTETVTRELTNATLRSISKPRSPIPSSERAVIRLALAYAAVELSVVR